MDDDDWQEMPVVRDAAAASSSSSDEGTGKGSRRKQAIKKAYSAKSAYNHGRSNSGYGTLAGGGQAGQVSGATNATGRHLDIDDARGYSWRAKPEGLGDSGGMGPAKKESKEKSKSHRKKGKGDTISSSSSSESDDDDSESGARGYTQLRLDDDPEAEDLNAATDYLFPGSAGGTGLDDLDGTGATPHSQLNTTKNLLSEGQKIAYVGLVSLAARSLVRQLERVPGKELKTAIASADEWRLRVMARMYQHMDIESGEQRMIESLAEHGVLMADLAPSLITTQTVENPDFDPQALLEREEEEERQRQEDDEKDVEEEAEIDSAKDGKVQTHAVERSEDPSTLEASDAENGDPGQDTHETRRAERAEDDPAEASTQDVEGEEGDLSYFDGGDLGDIDAPQAETGNTLESRDGSPKSSLTVDGLGQDITKESSYAQKQKEGHATGDTGHTIVDPNTATRLETTGESLEEAKVTPMGLTSQPQTIDTLPSALEGVTTELSSADKTITLDLRWTVLCDLFLVLTADSVYDARSRVLLERIAEELGLTWMDVTKFEKRVTDALEIEEGVSGSLKGKKAVRKRAEMARRRRLVMMGLATVGGGLVIGLSAGLMAPLIGAGLGAALGTVGIGGTTGFLSGIGGAAIITSTGTAAGAALGGTGMSRRTRSVRTFEFKPIHNNKRVNCIITVPGFMSGPQDDPRLPFSVVDSIMGDILSLLWEPDMMQEMGNAIYLLWSETLVQGVQQVLAATIAGGLVGALAWPLWLTKLGYFIDNPWSNALDRAHSCGLILADVLANRKVGVRPVTLVGFSLGARVIFYALVELARMKKFGIVQNVYLIGAPVTADDKTWKEARSVVAGRFVNAYSRTDWILGWLFRATTGGLRSIAGLRPVERVPEVENVDVTQTVPGHLQYRAFMPLVLAQLGFRTTAEYFDEPEDLERIPEREIIYDEPDEKKLKSVKTKSGGFGKIFQRKGGASESGSDVTPVSATSRRPSAYEEDDDDLPPREGSHDSQQSTQMSVPASAESPVTIDETEKILAELRENGIVVRELESSLPPLVAEPNPIPPPRQGSKLKGSITLEALQSEGSAATGENDDDEKKQPELRTAPVLTISDTEPSLASDAPTSASDPTAESQTADEDEASLSPTMARGRLTPTKPYARPFGSTTFDADGLPPSAPSISPGAEVSLSFGDAYEGEHAPDKHVSTTTTPGSLDEGRAADFSDSRQQYGLSADAPEELAMQFQSAGMSNAGALAAAQMARNFEALDVQDSVDIRQPSMPSSTYGTGDSAGPGPIGMDTDPWGAMAPSPSNMTPQAPTARPRGPSNADSQGILAVPPSTHTWNSDNPWD